MRERVQVRENEIMASRVVHRMGARDPSKQVFRGRTLVYVNGGTVAAFFIRDSGGIRQGV